MKNQKRVGMSRTIKLIIALFALTAIVMSITLIIYFNMENENSVAKQEIRLHRIGEKFTNESGDHVVFDDIEVRQIADSAYLILSGKISFANYALYSKECEFNYYGKNGKTLLPLQKQLTTQLSAADLNIDSETKIKSVGDFCLIYLLNNDLINEIKDIKQFQTGKDYYFHLKLSGCRLAARPKLGIRFSFTIDDIKKFLLT